jgi:hypothetical protein
MKSRNAAFSVVEASSAALTIDALWHRYSECRDELQQRRIIALGALGFHRAEAVKLAARTGRDAADIEKTTTS